MKFRRVGWFLLLLLPFWGRANSGVENGPEGFRYSTQGSANRLLKSLLDSSQKNFWINGHFNPYLISRNLSTGYPNTYGGLNNTTFAPYPNLLSPTVNTLQPTVLLRFGGQATEGLSFAVDYAFFYNYDTDKTHRYDFSSQNNLVADIYLKKSWGNFNFRAGAGVMPIHFSSLTLSNKYIRDPMFDRVPWEYHPNSVARYESNFRKSVFEPTIFNKTGTQGFYLEANDLPGNLEAKAFYGRTQLNLFPSEVLAGTPSQIAVFRVAKNWKQDNQLGINLYNNNAWADRRQIFHDLRTVGSLDGSFRIGKGRIKAEAGMAQLENPVVGKTTDLGGFLKYTRESGGLPFGIQVFGLGKNFVCLENEAYNANPVYRQGGFAGDTTYDNFLFPGYLNPAGTLANNRLGVDLTAEKKVVNFSVSAGFQTSGELVASGSVVSFPHMLNGYSRSRFAPWQQYTGPYSRIGNRFRMSIERIHLTKDADKLKFMSSAFLDLKYRIPLGRQALIVSSYSTAGTMGTKPLSSYFNLESGFLNTYFEELELSLPVHRSLILVGYAGWEWNKASRKTELSTETGNPLNQMGTGYGFGLDLEVAEYAGLYFRHRWMKHEDKSFVLDKFRGQESVVELKISF